MGALDVLPVALAKRYLNIPATSVENDTELAEDFIPPAVARVERHLWGDESGAQLDPLTITAPQRLAVRMVLNEYWRTQRAKVSRVSPGISGSAVETDAGPAGLASLTVRLTDLLGPPFSGGDAAPSSPTGSFPPPPCWPDPVEAR